MISAKTLLNQIGITDTDIAEFQKTLMATHESANRKSDTSYDDPGLGGITYTGTYAGKTVGQSPQHAWPLPASHSHGAISQQTNGSAGGTITNSTHSTHPSLSVLSGVGEEKTKVRYVIVKTDGSSLELKEQPQITPREMIGLSQLMSLISVYMATAVLGNPYQDYNFTIKWSELIKNLSIEKHFIGGRPAHNYNDVEVLDIFLFDPL